MSNVGEGRKFFYYAMNIKNVIHITGTNGKGSVANYIDAIVREAGYSSSLYTSPHIYLENERIKVNGEMISTREFNIFREKVREFADSKNIALSLFDATTLIALLYFNEKKSDFNIIEVGMGGLLDATNAFTYFTNPMCSIITSIDIDHTKYLGKTPQEIARHKSAIIKHKSFCISGPQHEEVAIIIRETCNKNRTKLYEYEKDFRIEPGENQKHTALFISDEFGIQEIKAPLLRGSHQILNASIGIMLAKIINQNAGLKK